MVWRRLRTQHKDYVGIKGGNSMVQARLRG